MDTSITLGDIIGYIITFIFGILAGVSGDRMFLRFKSTNTTKTIQKNNRVKNGDIIGRDKHVK